jgi:hypothetical protein
MSLLDRPVVVAAVAATLLAGCASEYTGVAHRPPEQYTKLGPAKGSSCGTMAFLGTAFNFIPIGLNERVENAYKNALASVPGSTAIINPRIEEDWYWWVLASTRCVTIDGEAVK